MANEKNYYEILGVPRSATQDEIKAAYRKLVKQYHPDLHPGDATCAEKMKEINEANDTLSDQQKRAQYDYELDNPYAGGFSGGSADGFGGFGDIFSSIFGGFGGNTSETLRRKGKDLTFEMSLSFLDAALGCTKEFSYTRKDRCSDCRGTGAKNGTALKKCTKCGGSGAVKITTGAGFFRSVTSRICDECNGSGNVITEQCPTCRGRGTAMVNTNIKFEIPAGADTGSYIKRREYGETPDNGGEPGDLIMFFKVKPHRLFTRKDYNLYVTVPVPFTTACFGGKVMVPGLDKPFEYDIPEGTQSGKVICLKGKGIRGRGKPGDLYVTIQVETPVKISRKQKEELVSILNAVEKKQMPISNTYRDNMGKEYGIDPYDK